MPLLTPEFLSGKFNAALPYDAYVATGTPEQRDKWASAASHIQLTSTQQTLIRAFTRRVNILISSGLWCGDCSSQCPMLAAIGKANPSVIDLRFLNRDTSMDLAEKISICGGYRVPTVVFLNEEFDLVCLTGDKSLSRLRATAKRKLGPACELPGAPVPADETAATLQDWLSEVERVHLLLRLSTKLRAKHGD